VPLGMALHDVLAGGADIQPVHLAGG
jgi:hypothetical protein